MNDFPPETVLHIFQYLSGKDISRFRRLKKSIKEVIDNNRRRDNGVKNLPYPKISLALGQTIDNRGVPGLFTITMDQLTLVVAVKEDEHIEMVNNNPVAQEFYLSFCDSVSQVYEPPVKEHFLCWLFHLADIEILELRPSENWDNDINLVFHSINSTACRCGPVLLMDHLNLLEYFPNLEKDFKEFCEIQKEFGVSPKLETTSQKAQYCIRSRKPDIDILNTYSTFFDSVTCTYSYQFIYTPLLAIARQWIVGRLQAVNFKVRFDFNLQVEHIPAYLSKRDREEFLTLRLQFMNISRQEFSELIDGEPRNAFDRFPEHFACTNRDVVDMLIFKFTKVENFVVLEVELSDGYN